jgi:hypothetical protein
MKEIKCYIDTNSPGSVAKHLMMAKYSDYLPIFLRPDLNDKWSFN